MQILFPNQLKKYRNEAGFSQEDIAGKLFVSRQAISRWEAGEATPDLANLIKLTEIFDCSLDSLVLGIQTQDNEKVDSKEFVFDPRKGKYVRRHGTMNFWDFVASYWWLVFVFGGFIVCFTSAMFNIFV